MDSDDTTKKKPMDFLFELGVLERNSKEPEIESSFLNLELRSPGPAPTQEGSPSQDPGLGVGELLPSQPKRISTPIPETPHSQPSIFWKAFANTIVSLLSNASNLADEDQAIFFATPTQAGIPGGDIVPPEVTNFQVFTKADAVQKLDHPGFSLDGASYFDLLGKYFRSLTSDSDYPNIDAVRKVLLKATEEKDAAWKGALARYGNRINDTSKTLPFNTFVSHDSAYNEAWYHELEVQKNYTRLQGHDMEDICRQLDIIKSADDRFVSKTYNNMPCSAMSEDYVRRAMYAPSKIKVDPATIFYRPFYALPNWKTTCNTWATNKRNPISYTINFSQLADVTWESLGHKNLDKAPPPKLTENYHHLLNKLRGKLTFYDRPAVMDIDRGLWDKNQLRYAGQLSERAPDNVKHRFCKTTKFLLTWGFDIELTLPESIGTQSVDDVNLAFLRVPVAEVSNNGRVLKFSTEQTNYPWLIAALASVV